MSRLDCVTSCHDVLEDFTGHIKSLHSRYANISNNHKEFLMILKLAKPVHVKQFTILNDVISVHSYLRASPSVGKSVQTDLVTDFLSVVNLSRLKLSDLITKVKAVERHAIKYTPMTLVDNIYRTVGEVSGILDPAFSFNTVPNDGSVFMGIMDTKMFGNLVYYIPYVFVRLNEVCDVIKHVMDDLSMTSQTLNNQEGDGENNIVEDSHEGERHSCDSSDVIEPLVLPSRKTSCPCSVESTSRDVVNIPS